VVRRKQKRALNNLRKILVSLKDTEITDIQRTDRIYSVRRYINESIALLTKMKTQIDNKIAEYDEGPKRI